MLNYYRIYLSYLFSLDKIKWHIKSYFGEVKRDTRRHLQWQAIFEAQDTKRPAKVCIGNDIFKAFPCGCEQTYYENGKVWRDAFRCYNKKHRKRYFPYM